MSVPDDFRANTRPYFQQFLIPLVNAHVFPNFVAHLGESYRLSFQGLTANEKEKWATDPCVRCSLGNFKFMLDRAKSAVVLEADYAGHPLDDEDAANMLGSLIAFIDIRLPYVLWTPFGEQRMSHWPSDSFKISALGLQRIPSEMECYATVNVDDATFKRYWSAILDTSETGLKLRRALGRHRYARVSMYSEDAIINSFIGIEALFNDYPRDVGESAKRIRERAASYITGTEDSRSLADLIDISERIKELAKARNLIIHGADPGPLATPDSVQDSMRLLALTVLRALEEGFERLSDLEGLAKDFERDRQEAERQRAEGKTQEPPDNSGDDGSPEEA